MFIKNCKYCDVAFSKPYECSKRVWNTTKKWCSRKCLYSWRRENKEEWKRIIKFVKMPEGKKFYKGMKPVQKIVWNKGLKGIHQSPKSEFKRGQFSREKHPNWKGGITPMIMRIRTCWEYNEWKKEIFRKDNYTCQICLKRGGKLQIDHYPKPFSQVILENNVNNLEEAIECRELWDIENGRVLCENCHKSWTSRMLHHILQFNKNERRITT